MFALLIVIAAATVGAVTAVILLIAWAVRREDDGLTMVDPAPGPAAYAVRRLLGLYATGVATPGQDQHTVRRAGHPSIRSGQPGTAGWPDHDDLPADWPGPRGPGPAWWDTPAGV